MKKTLLFFLILFAISATSNTLQAQEMTIQEIENSIKPDGKYGVFINEARQLQGVVLTVEQLHDISKNIRFQIVMAGPILKELGVKDNKLLPLVVRAQKAGARMVACEIALKKLGVKKEDLPPSIQVTSNAAIYIFGLQENGYKML